MRQLVLLVLYTFLSLANAQDSSSGNKSFDKLIESYAEFIYEDASKALDYALQAKELAVINGNNEQLTRASYYISKCQHKLAKNKNALKNIETAIQQGNTTQDSLLLYHCFCLKGDILSSLGEDSKALITYLKAKDYGKHVGGFLYEIAPLTNIASIKKIHKDFEEAITIYKSILKSLKTFKEDGDIMHYRLSAYINIADAYLWMKNPDDAEIYNKAGLNECAAKMMEWAYYPLLMNKAIIFYQKENYAECKLVAKQVRDYAIKTKKEGLYLTALFYLGKSAYNLNDYTETINYLEKAYDKINASDNIDVNEKELHEFLTLAYHKEHKHEKSVFHFQKYTALEKKQSTEDLKLNNETHKLLDVSPLKTEIDNLGEQLTKQTRNKKEYIILSIVLLFLLLWSIVYYKIRGTYTKKKFKELLKKVSELENNQEKKNALRKDKVSDENVKAILSKIDSFEKNEYYLATECNLSFMAEKLETNATYLSKVINAHKGKSFTAYITELRINTALVRLKNDKTLQSYTIKAIAEEFGFKRQETFSRAFKAHTGIHPSQYLKNL